MRSERIIFKGNPANLNKHLPYARSKIKQMDNQGDTSKTYPLFDGKSWVRIDLKPRLVIFYFILSEGRRFRYLFYGSDVHTAMDDDYLSYYTHDLTNVYKELQSSPQSFVVNRKYGADNTALHSAIAQNSKAKINVLDDSDVFFTQVTKSIDDIPDGYRETWNGVPKVVAPLDFKRARFTWSNDKVTVLGGVGNRHAEPFFYDFSWDGRIRYSRYIWQNNDIYYWAYKQHLELKPVLLNTTGQIVVEGGAGSECISAIYRKGWVVGITCQNEIRYFHKDKPEKIKIAKFDIPYPYNQLEQINDALNTQWQFNDAGDKAIGLIYRLRQEPVYNNGFQESHWFHVAEGIMALVELDFEIDESDELIVTPYFFYQIVDNPGLIAADWYRGELPSGEHDAVSYALYKREETKEIDASEIVNPQVFDNANLVQDAFGLRDFSTLRHFVELHTDLTPTSYYDYTLLYEQHLKYNQQGINEDFRAIRTLVVVTDAAVDLRYHAVTITASVDVQLRETAIFYYTELDPYYAVKYGFRHPGHEGYGLAILLPDHPTDIYTSEEIKKDKKVKSHFQQEWVLTTPSHDYLEKHIELSKPNSTTATGTTDQSFKDVSIIKSLFVPSMYKNRQYTAVAVQKQDSQFLWAASALINRCWYDNTFDHSLFNESYPPIWFMHPRKNAFNDQKPFELCKIGTNQCIDYSETDVERVAKIDILRLVEHSGTHLELTRLLDYGDHTEIRQSMTYNEKFTDLYQEGQLVGNPDSIFLWKGTKLYQLHRRSRMDAGMFI